MPNLRNVLVLVCIFGVVLCLPTRRDPKITVYLPSNKYLYSFEISPRELTLRLTGLSLADKAFTRKDFINSAACSSVYHGRCIDTYQTQCMGLVIPGICGNMTYFSGIEVGGLTKLQCCNSWMNVDLSGTVVVGESTDGPFVG